MSHINGNEIKLKVHESVRTAIRKHSMIKAGDSVVVGLSGGPDSVCLFHSLTVLSAELGIKEIIAVHINHGLRGDESNGDEDYAGLLASKSGASFRSCRVDVNAYAAVSGLSTELAGRRLRYGIFESICREVGAAAVAVAHNSDDQAETVLMRIMRGTGLNGLGGISYVRKLEKTEKDIEDFLNKISTEADDNSNFEADNKAAKTVRIIRPILDISRSEIEAYCEAYDLRPRIDRTNLLPIYTRNKIRLNLIPVIEKEFNPEIKQSLIRLASQAVEDEDCLRGFASKEYIKRWNNEEKSLNLRDLKKIHRAVAVRLLRISAASAGLERDIEAQHIERIMELIYAGEESKEADLTKKYFVRYSYEKLWFLKRDEARGIIEKPISFPFKEIDIKGKAVIATGSIRLNIELISAEALKKRKRDVLYLDYDALKQYSSVIIRNRMSGDRIRVRGLNGSKKVQDFMTDRKIPKHKRNRIPLIAADGNILAVGKEAAENCALTDCTKRVLAISLENEISL